MVTENTELMGKKSAAGGGGGDLTLSPAGSGPPQGHGGATYGDLDSRSTSSSLGVIPRPPAPRSSTSYSGYERLPVQRHQIQLISLLGPNHFIFAYM